MEKYIRASTLIELLDKARELCLDLKRTKQAEVYKKVIELIDRLPGENVKPVPNEKPDCECYHLDQHYGAVCWGTKECDPCDCDGIKSKCTYYLNCNMVILPIGES